MDDPPNHDKHSAEASALVAELLAVMLETSGARLQVERSVACGGVGSIHAVFDGVLRRPLAKKTLLSVAQANPVLVRAFLREACITAQLDHPNIVPVHDFGIDADSQVYFTMRLVQGPTLAERITELHVRGASSTDSQEGMLGLVEIIVRVCDALAFAHSRGVIHCDLKAENVMVGRFGQVYLMDWGFAQLVPLRPGQEADRRVQDPLPALPGHLTAGIAFGTPGYMSPEQAYARLDEMDERSDIFSIGALLYHVLAGHPPYHDDTKLWRLLKAQDCKFMPLVAAVDAAPPRPAELIRIIDRAMARDPADRYPGVEDLASDLRRFLHGGDPASVRVAAGTTIIAEGESADAAFFIQSGRCEVFVTKGGSRTRIEELVAGDCFGEGALLASARRLVGVATLTDTVILKIPAELLKHEMTMVRPWVRSLLKGLAGRVRSLREHQIGGVRTRRWWRRS